MELIDLKKQFLEIFGGCDENLRVFYSAGRVNLIGEHTDTTGGYVFPAALTLGTTIIARKREDDMICLAATDLPDRPKAKVSDLAQYREIPWGNYQYGVASEMQKDGYHICGVDALYYDSVPHGAGLSSSAAIEVATAVMFAAFSNEQKGEQNELDMVYMAKVSQRAENQYIGVNCGIMDQFASAMGKKNCAIFLNCKTLAYQHVPLNLNGYKVVIANTNKKRSLQTSGYNERRKSCEDGFAVLKQHIDGVTCLGEVTPEQLTAHLQYLTDENQRKRVSHVVSENARVKESVAALQKGDLKTFGKLMIQSHESLRDLFEVTCLELDTLVEEALKIDGVIGSRMTGAGFGGCTVSIVREDAVQPFIEFVGKHYQEKTGLTADFYLSEIGDGGREVK